MRRKLSHRSSVIRPYKNTYNCHFSSRYVCCQCISIYGKQIFTCNEHYPVFGEQLFMCNEHPFPYLFFLWQKAIKIVLILLIKRNKNFKIYHFYLFFLSANNLSAAAFTKIKFLFIVLTYKNGYVFHDKLS